MNRKILIGAGVSLIVMALTCYAAVTTVTGSRILASFVKEMHSETAIILCSDSPASSVPLAAGLVTNWTSTTAVITDKNDQVVTVITGLTAQKTP